MTADLKAIGTAQLVEELLHRLATQLATEGERVKGGNLASAIQALSVLPTLRCDKCTARCALDFYDVTEIGRNPATGGKIRMGYTACASCYKKANQ